MRERYDLKELLREVEIDDAFDEEKTGSRVNQDDIKKLLEQKKRSARKTS